MVTKAKKALLASLAAFLCVMLTVFGLGTASIFAHKTANAADEAKIVVNGTEYATFEEARDKATPDGDGVITYTVFGKNTVSSTDAWIQVVQKGLDNVKAVKFVGNGEGAELVISNPTSVFADQEYDLDVSFEGLTLSHPNGAYVGDLGHTTNYFATALRNTNAKENTVTYTNCTFPNGVCNNSYGNTVFTSCKFTSTAGKYGLWVYGGSVEVDKSSFSGARGVKTYTETKDLEVVETELSFNDVSFSGITEKAAVVVSKAANVEMTAVNVENCEKGLLQKAISDTTYTIEANGSNISGKFNVTGTNPTEVAKTEFNISSGEFTEDSKIDEKYYAENVTITPNEDGTFGVDLTDYVVVGGIKGFEKKKFASFEEAYNAIKPIIEKLGGLVEGSASATAFDAIFTDRDENGNAKLTYTIKGNVVYDETSLSNLLTMGRKASHYGNDRHLIKFAFVGVTADKKDTLTVNSNITLPYEWWGEKVTTSISFENLTITGSAPNGLYTYQKFFEGIDFTVNNCTLKGIKIYNCANVGGSYTITSSVLDGTGAAANAYAIHLQGNETAPLTINISGNAITGYDRGVNIDQATAVAAISGNTISVNDTNRSCVQLTKLAETTITGNTLNLTGGNAITLHSNLAEGSKITVKANTIEGNGYLVYDDTQKAIDLTYGENTVAATVDMTKGVYGGTTKDLSDDVYNEVHHVLAEVNGVKFATLAEAIAAAKDGETVKLLADVEQNSQLSIKKNITLDLNGKKIYNTKDIWGDNAVAVIAIKDGAEVTVMGDGTIAAKKDDCYTFNIVNGELTIENGTFVGNISVVQVQKGTLTINGGTFSLLQKWEGEDRYLINCIDAAFTANDAKVAIYGGSFAGFDPNVSPEKKVDGKVPSFAAPGVGITKNKDGSFTAKANMAAQILDSDGNSVEAYATLEEAVGATVVGQTVMLLTNVTISKQLEVSKANTLDLNGKTLTSEYKSDSGVYAIAVIGATLTNGTIQVENARAIGAYGAMTMDGVTVENGIKDGHATIGLLGAGSEYVIRKSTINGAYSVAVFANNATVTIENSKITGRGPALYHNGSNYGLRLTVTDTTLTSAACSVYISGSASMKDQADNRNNADGYQQATFTRCTISGTNGIEVKYTNLTLNSCNISATVKTPTYEQNNNGSTASGFAVVSTDNATGGTTPAPKGTIAVSGEGNYVGAIGIGTLVKNKYESFEDASYAVSGGKFNHAILPEYCADGFIPTQNADGTYGVKEGTYVAEVKGVKYETLQAAIDKAAKGATVTLLANTKENVTIAKELTLDLNGYTINGGQVKAKPTILVSNCSVTITDSSEAKKGTVKREDTAENSGVSSHYVIDIQGKYGFLKVEGGNFINNSGAGGTRGASLIRVGNDSDRTANPTLTINGGTFTQDNFIVIKVDFGTLHFKGGELNSKNSYAIENWRTAYIKGGSVNGDVSSWVYSDGVAFSKLEISAGTINGDVESVSNDGATDKQARVYITGGTVTGSLSNVVCGQVGDADKALAMIEVTGGTFSIDPTKYVVESSKITKNKNGTYGVEKAYLAKVGDTSYYTMDEAFKAQTASGEAIVLLRDYTTGSTFNSGTKHRVVDLNGHTWMYTGTDMNSAAFEINNPNATLTVKNGKIISSTLVGLIPSAMGGTITYDNAGLVFEGVEMTAKGSSGIETNGNNTNDSVTLKNSTLNVPNGFGIYFPSSGTLTIDNSTINANTMGVQVCSGTLNINAGSAITVSGDAVPKTENDGAIQDGAAISIVNRTGYKGLSNIVITGGTFTAKAGNDAIKAYDWTDKVESEFTKADLVAVSGGTFSSEVKKDYLAKGYRLTKTGESYGVTAKYIESTHVSLGTALSFSYKLRVLNEGETVKNAKASYRTVRGNLVEINMTLVDGYYVFDGITPQMLDRKISVNVYVGDTVVYDVVDYSILDYLQDLLNTDLGTKATVTKQLVADIAFYGKAAMNYVGYTTDVVDKFIKDNGLTQSTGDMTGVAKSSGTEKVANVSVQFASQNKILIGVDKNVFNDYSYTIKVNGTEIDKALWQTDVVDGYCVYVSDGFAARYITDASKYVEVEVLKNGASVQKVQCNVAGYCMKMAENAKMSELAKATYYYGVSAAEYANFKG